MYVYCGGSHQSLWTLLLFCVTIGASVNIALCRDRWGLITIIETSQNKLFTLLHRVLLLLLLRYETKAVLSFRLFRLVAEALSRAKRCDAPGDKQKKLVSCLRKDT